MDGGNPFDALTLVAPMVDPLGVTAALQSDVHRFGPWIKKNTKSDNVKSAIDLLEQAAKDTVGELQQTLVEGWKEANADGKLADDEIRTLKLRSLSLVKKRIGSAAQEAISAAGINLEDRIIAGIEAAITAMKSSSVVVISEAALANME